MSNDSQPLTAEQQQRYARQLGPGVLTPAGQARLQNATVLVSRVGGMGGPAALMMAMAGVGRIIIAHGGELISPDLNRQVLGHEEGLGKPRAGEFADYLRSMSSFIEVEAIDHEPDDQEAMELATRCDLICSCPPTFGERLRLNRVAVAAGIPLIDAAQWGMTGTLMVLQPPRSACLQCVYPEAPPFEEFFPVLGAISAATGSLAALEAVKILAGSGEPLYGKMLSYDGYRGLPNVISLSADPDCPCCSGAGQNE